MEDKYIECPGCGNKRFIPPGTQIANDCKNAQCPTNKNKIEKASKKTHARNKVKRTHGKRK